MAVSAEEKNAESKIRIITAINWKIVLESKVVSLLLNIKHYVFDRKYTVFFMENQE